ncbi:SpoIIE family protein phosphatase [Yinghuangia seranimata]|uniref:SpoIIE family protein phosphatase n=1 Tax=Yinghuangia seranimata TaxID=408067 RepID=UPI00248D3197|nr:SpoIIE family protein phosphatase [Yinghuangia seranimata]MDI2125393.1 SpoIIE family protein phosphatase [Yinghuangia seranimata]
MTDLPPTAPSAEERASRDPPGDGTGQSSRGETEVLTETIDRLRAEVSGLRRAMRSRGVIEQAKGVLMARMSCSADEAFAYLATVSQHDNVKLVDVAAGVLGVAAPDTRDGHDLEDAPTEDARDSRGPRDAERARRGVVPHSPARIPPRVDLARGAPEARDPQPPATFAARYHVAASALASAADTGELARLLRREGVAALGAHAVAVARLEADGGLRLAGTDGVPEAQVSAWHRIPPQTALPLSDAVRSGRPVLVRDRAEFTARYPLPGGEPLMPGESLCALPLTAPDGGVVGALAVSWPRPTEALDDADAMTYLTALAGLCARALARLTAWTASSAEPSQGGDRWFRSLLDALLDPVMILAPVHRADAEDDADRVEDFRVEYANTATVDLAGRTAEDMVGGRMSELYPGMVTSGVFAQLLEVQATGTPYEGVAEQFVELVGGTLHSSTMTLRAVRFLDGLLLSWRIHDVGERQAAQLAQAQRLAHIGTWHYDVGTGEVVWSPEMFAITGLRPADGAPSPGRAAALVDGRTRAAITAAWHELLTEHRPQTVEFLITRPDGGARTVRVAAGPAPGPADEPVLAVSGVLQDVSAWQRTRAALATARSELVEERGRTEAEHDLVRALQQALVRSPDSYPEHVRFAAHYVPAESAARVGGDWYDVAGLPDGRALVAVGDVSGHGLTAAAGMTQLRHALRGMAYTGADPAKILGWLNVMLCHQRADYIATAVCGHLDPASGVLTWAQAGHLPPLRVRVGTADVLTPPPGMVLGAAAEAEYRSATVSLDPGDIVLMYTDGLVAHRGGGLGRGLSQLLSTVREGPTDDLQACVTHVMRHLGAPNPRDDTCLVGFQVPQTDG